MKITLCAFCEDVIRDTVTSSTTLYKLIDEIRVEALPLFLSKFSIFVLVRKEDFNAEEFQLKLYNTDNLIFQHEKVKVNYADKDSSRIVLKTEGLAITRPGNLRVEISYNGEVIGEFNCPIKISPSTTVEAEA